jgi:sugar lactone lactonase YvrE
MGSADGTASAAQFNNPAGITTDGSNLYVVDSGNSTIRKVVIATGAVTTLAGSAGVTGSNDGAGSTAQFNWPSSITTDGVNLYVSDTYNHTIRKVVIATRLVTTLAGSVGVSGSTDGTGSAAQFNLPNGITTDGTNLYVVDTFNQTIRKVDIATGTVSTPVGSVGATGSTDGAGTAARFYFPYGISIDGPNLYVADSGNNLIRKVVITTGTVTTVAGSTEVSKGSANGTGVSARFFNPGGITTDGINLYVADTYNHTIRKVVIASGLVTTLAGSAGVADSVDGTGSSARFYNPFGITTDGTNLYVTDSTNRTIRKVVIATGEVTTLAGSVNIWGSTDGIGTTARFGVLYGITTDGTNLYVSDSGNNTIRKVVIATGEVTTLAGSAGASNGSIDGTGSAARFAFPISITTDGTNLYVADSYNNTIRKVVKATGEVTTLAGSAGVSGLSDGIGSVARFSNPNGITTDGINLFVADTDNNTIRKVVIASGLVTTLEGSPGSSTSTQFYSPRSITTDGIKLYISNSSNNTIDVIQ